MPNRMTYKERRSHATIMSAFAKVHLAEGLDTWKGEDDMIDMVRSDARDYRKIASLLRTESCAAAYELAHSLDTSARECVPDSVWYAMDEDMEAREENIQEFEDDITRRHIAALTCRKESLERQIEKAEERLHV